MLKLIREQAEKMVSIKEACNCRTKVIINVMSDYESNGFGQFIDQNASKLIVENPHDTELKDKCEGMT